MNSTWQAGNSSRSAAASSPAVSTSIRRTPAGSGSETLAATRVTCAPRRAACSASASPIRPLERLPMKRTESIGSRVPPAVTRTRSPSHDPPAEPAGAPRPRPAGGRARAACPHPSPLATPAPPPRARSPARRARAASPGSPGWRRPRTSGRSSPGRRRAARRRPGTRWSTSSRRSRRQAWRRCWPTPARSGRRPHWRPAPGGRSGRGPVSGSPGKAPRRGSRSNSSLEDRRADDALEGRRAHEPPRGRGHQHPDAVPGQGRQSRQLQCLVGGDPAAHAEKDAGHLGAPPAPGYPAR